jgi:hypothetical protein
MVLIPMHPMIPRPRALMDHRYNSLPFLIENSNSYSLTSQTFMLHGSHMGPAPVMSWRGSPTAEQPPMQVDTGRQRLQVDTGHHCLQSAIQARVPALLPGHEYWPPPLWAPPARGQAPSWGMPPWTTPTTQPQQPSSSPPMKVICAYFQLFHL